MNSTRTRTNMLVAFLALGLVAGCSKTSTPEGTVGAFLDEINAGNTESAKLYFSGQYSGGYDERDKRHLEESFPPGSIGNISYSNLKVLGESATLTVTIERKSGSPYTTNLSMVKKGRDWKINYDGWSWPFPSR